MCPPERFAVEYAINPWMDTTASVDAALALKQWQALRDTLTDLGHAVHVLDPQPGLPDMVYAANGAFSVDGTVYGARFRFPQRAEEATHHSMFYRNGPWTFVDPMQVNEGEGDFAYLPGAYGGLILAGHGFRTDPRSHQELAALVGRRVVPLRLVNPWFYHLDTALAVLDDDPAHPDLAWYPAAFSAASQRIVRDLFPDALAVGEADARVLGLNLVSDGEHVLVPAAAAGLRRDLADRGYQPIPVELDELLAGGGSLKCCTQRLRASEEATP